MEAFFAEFDNGKKFERKIIFTENFFNRKW
jgi:hypothetical protein